MKNFEDFMKEHGNSTNQLNATQKQENKNIEEFDKLKTKVLKYVLYKKRTEKEIRQKFASSSIDENLLEDVLENLKENGYINDESYIKRAVDEYLAINTLSLKQIRNKLYTKGLSSDIIETYFANYQDELENYELDSAKKIILKKQTQLEKEQIEQFLYKKGYPSNCVKLAFEELEV